MLKATDRQVSLLRYIIRYHEQHGYPVSIREIGAQFGIRSVRGVTVHLDSLERKGLITRSLGATRSLTVTREGHRAAGTAEIALPSRLLTLPEGVDYYVYDETLRQFARLGGRV
jgi:repressor LexA